MLVRVALCCAIGGTAAANPAAVPGAQTRAEEALSLVQLARRYETGDGVAQDFAKSNQLYCKAAARGNARALVQLALIHSSGREVEADEGVAALLLARAAALGDGQAQALLEHVSRRAGSALPACLDEPLPDVVATRDDGSPALAGASRSRIEALVHRLAPQYAIDPDLVLAVMATESGFQPNAVSPKNAQGLMQLVPATAGRFGVRKVFDPVDNLKGGLAYLQWLLAFFEGDVELVLAAYNAGEEAVARHRGIPPYPETRSYVKRITSVYRKARHPYEARVTAPSPMLNLIRREPARNVKS